MEIEVGTYEKDKYQLMIETRAVDTAIAQDLSAKG